MNDGKDTGLIKVNATEFRFSNLPISRTNFRFPWRYSTVQRSKLAERLLGFRRPVNGQILAKIAKSLSNCYKGRSQHPQDIFM